MDQKQVRVYWGPGPQNEGGYFIKHHPPSHHKYTRNKHLSIYLLLSKVIIHHFAHNSNLQYYTQQIYSTRVCYCTFAFTEYTSR